MTTQPILIQDGDDVREATPKEMLELEQFQNDAQEIESAHQSDQQAKATARASALAKLADLGLTAEEVAAL
jgi:hypothetical protein